MTGCARHLSGATRPELTSAANNQAWTQSLVSLRSPSMEIMGICIDNKGYGGPLDKGRKRVQQWYSNAATRDAPAELGTCHANSQDETGYLDSCVARLRHWGQGEEAKPASKTCFAFYSFQSASVRTHGTVRPHMPHALEFLHGMFLFTCMNWLVFVHPSPPFSSIMSGLVPYSVLQGAPP